MRPEFPPPDDDDDDDTTELPALEVLIEESMIARFRLALTDHFAEPRAALYDRDLIASRATSLMRVAYMGDDTTLAVAVWMLLALRASGQGATSLAALFDVARYVDRERLARYLPAAILEAIPERD